LVQLVVPEGNDLLDVAGNNIGKTTIPLTPRRLFHADARMCGNRGGVDSLNADVQSEIRCQCYCPLGVVGRGRPQAVVDMDQTHISIEEGAECGEARREGERVRPSRKSDHDRRPLRQP
jgi:hypothetical protein